MSLDPTLPKPPAKVPSWLLISWLILSGLGFADATYLTVNHYLGKAPTCSVVHGCDVVLSSQYAMVGPVPVALVGALYYLVLLVAGVGYWESRNKALMRWAAHFTWAGLLASAGFVYLQAVVIGSWCQFCLISAVTSTLLFVVGQLWLWRLRIVS